MRLILSHLRGALVILLWALNTCLWVPLIYIVAVFKLIIPINAWQKFCHRVLNGMASNWISGNEFFHRLLNRVKWDIKGADGLKLKEWYLVLSNHQSWADVMVLQWVFNRKVPFLKFFIKKELIWVPFFGLAWWAMDFPFMKRHSREEIAKNPELKGEDLEITRKACEKFAHIPVSIMNFVEGTRFTKEKHDRQDSPFSHLLKPKAGGIAFVLGSMGDKLHEVLNVTISYPRGVSNFWGFLCGKVDEVKVHVETIPITREMLGNYFQDQEYRDRFHQWLNTLWDDKDRRLSGMTG